MAVGTAYTKRYAGGFVDKPTLTTPIDQAFLNAVESALLQLIGSAPVSDGQVMQWDNANTRYGPALLLNKNIDAAAAISKSKLDFTGANGIVNADVAGAAAIARSKLDFGSGLVNADIAAAAGIAASKLAAYPTDGAQVLKGDGTWGRNIYKPTMLTFSNTAAEKDLIGTDGSGFQIPANVMGATGLLRVTIIADVLQSSGGNLSLGLAIKFGATTLWSCVGGPVAMATSAVHRILYFHFVIANTATNAQSMGGTIGLGATGNPPTTAGLGNYMNGSNAVAGSANNASDFIGSSAPAAVDTTANQNLRVTGTWSAATATTTITTRAALIEVL